MTRLRPAWDRFWFAPEPASTLALLRIALALVVLLWAVALAPDLRAFFGPDAVVPGSPAAFAAYGLLVVAAASLLVGYRTRLAGAAVFAALVWLFRANPYVLNAGDALMRDVAFFVMLGPAGASFSLDRRRSSAPPLSFPRIEPWAVRLVQLQISVMYLAAVGAKLSGSRWRDGTAVSYPLRLPEETRIHLPGALLASPTAAHLLTWGTLAVEASVGVLVWWRPARRWVLLLGVGLHLSIGLLLRVGFFSWVVIVAYLAFVPPQTAERVLLGLARAGAALRGAASAVTRLPRETLFRS